MRRQAKQSDCGMRNAECGPRRPPCASAYSAIRNPQSAFPRGLTLIELLVTIAIMVTVLAGVIPLMSPNNNGRKIREASRQLNTLLQQAKAQAARDGRPVGIAFREAQGAGGANSGVALQAYLIAEPEAFSGFSNWSAVQLHLAPPPGGGPPVVDAVKFVTQPIDPTTGQFPPDPLPPDVVRQLDFVEIDGYRYRLVDKDRDGDGTPDDTANPPFLPGQYYQRYVTGGADLDALATYACQPTTADPPLLNFTAGVGAGGWTTAIRPYYVRRLPSNTSDQPLQFPRGIGIDLTASGIQPVIPTPPNPVQYGFTTMLSETQSTLKGVPSTFERPLTVGITFDENGLFDALYINGEKWEEPPPFPQVNLLLGLAVNGNPESTDLDFVSTPVPDDELALRRQRVNWFNQDSAWVSVSRPQGRVVSSEMTTIDPRHKNFVGDPPDRTPEEQAAFQIIGGRQGARESRGAGGR